MKEDKLSIAMITRPNLFTVPGGDTIQIVKTAESLKQLFGIHIDIVLDGEVNYKNYSLIHFFNIICPEDILGHVNNCTIPFVISTIYVDYHEYDRFHRKDLLGYLSRFIQHDRMAYVKTLAKYILKKERTSTWRFFIKGHKRSIEYILKKAELLLPNSTSEYLRLKADYGIHKKHVVVPNAIDPDLFQNKKEVKREIVLCVGRIEGRKNQLNVIRALKNTPYKIVFIGQPAPNQLDYFDKCKAEATDKMKFFEFMPQEQLVDYYSRARVHILASWFETTGLSNLEAGVMGCNLVIGDRGDVRDYFEDMVHYCEPGDLKSIRDAVNKAWDSKPNILLQEKIVSQFTWEQAASVTAKAYQTVLSINVPLKQVVA